MECDGNCDEHRGEVQQVTVTDPKITSGGYWGIFWYCETAIEDDRRNGLRVEFVQLLSDEAPKMEIKGFVERKELEDYNNDAAILVIYRYGGIGNRIPVTVSLEEAEPAPANQHQPKRKGIRGCV